ncbi:uncharacterized protein [Amphiura filiformis]|uniref:uncharacterized protein isoform X2 n=1 Tax=Amphiura filiformis TaxID=82378 RepID=UPI003B20CC52
MKINLVILVTGISIMFCNSANSESVDCIALCDQCVEVSDTLSHMSCTKHCEEHKQNDNGKMPCSKLTAPNKGSLSLENEINAANVRRWELAETIEEGGDYSAIVEKLFTDDCINIINGQTPAFDKEVIARGWSYWFESNHVNRGIDTTNAFGENNGKVWEDGIMTAYHDDAAIGSFRYIFVYKRVNGTLLNFINIFFD